MSMGACPTGPAGTGKFLLSLILNFSKITLLIFFP